MEKFFFYTSDFKLKKVHRLGFWNRKSNGNASDFDLKVYIGSDFELMKKHRVRFGIKKNNVSDFEMNTLQGVIFWIAFFCLVTFWNKTLQRVRIWIDWKHNASVFKLNFLQRVSFRFDLFLCSQILKQKRWNVLVFELKALPSVRFWIGNFLSGQILT